MKKYSILITLLSLLTFTSCLKGNLEDLPEFEDNFITGVQKVEFRWISDEISNSNGQNVVKYVTLDKKVTVDKDNSTVSIEVTVPAANNTFTEAVRATCTQSNIAVMVSLSTAAKITPANGAPKLGLPGDWSKPNKYVVMAANGDKRDWTIQVTKFTK